MSVLKRQRERKKAEKAALKRERRGHRKDSELLIATEVEKRGSKESRKSEVATKEDLAGYGFPSEVDSETED